MSIRWGHPLTLILPLIAAALVGCRQTPPPPDAVEPSASEQQPRGTSVAQALDRAMSAPPQTRPASASRGLPVDASGLPPTGVPCRVHLRRDVMGLTGVSPLAIQGAGPSMRAVTLQGTIDHATADWIVLRTPERTFWLPTGVILAVEAAP